MPDLIRVVLVYGCAQVVEDPHTKLLQGCDHRLALHYTSPLARVARQQIQDTCNKGHVLVYVASRNKLWRLYHTAKLNLFSPLTTIIPNR